VKKKKKKKGRKKNKTEGRKDTNENLLKQNGKEQNY
jgi:hypothetical protein